MKKNKTLIYIAIAGLAIWYFMKNKKKQAAGESAGTAGSSIQATGSAAKQLVEATIDKTTFVPDNTTDRDLYQQDKNQCL
jgi:hypothetical protein